MKKIEWNKVTWYSKLLAVIVFLATFYIAFNLGKESQAMQDQAIGLTILQPSMDQSSDQSVAHEAVLLADPILNDVTFMCAGKKTVRAQFYKNNVELELSDGRHLIVPHAISADGARYANTDESFVFWTRGQGAFIDEGTSTTNQVETYKDCVVTK